MKRLLGLLMMVGLLVGMSVCGVDLNIFEQTNWNDDVFLLKPMVKEMKSGERPSALGMLIPFNKR
jgi:hypothetical protein